MFFFIFPGPRELEQSEHLAQLQSDLSIQLSKELRQLEFNQKIWPATINEFLQKHEILLLEAVSAGFGEGGGGSIWTYPGCILFAVSLLTTLGEYPNTLSILISKSPNNHIPKNSNIYIERKLNKNSKQQ